MKTKPISKEQLLKILKIAIVATVLMFAFEVLFSHSVITDWIGSSIAKADGWIVYLCIWIIMFVQVCFIPIPAYIVLSAAISVNIIPMHTTMITMFATGSTWLFIGVTISAYMAGAMVAYWMGRRWGKRAVMWCAGSDEEYNKWSTFITTRGKWPYALTILLPIFPDDLLCLVAGSVRFDARFFFWSNLICRSIGLICMLAALKGISSGGIWTTVGWGIALLALVIAYVIVNQLKKKENK